MNVVNNLRMLGGQPDTKKRSTGAFGLKFEIHKVKVISSFKLINFLSFTLLLKILLTEEACCKERTSWGRREMAVITVLSHNRGTN